MDERRGWDRAILGRVGTSCLPYRLGPKPPAAHLARRIIERGIDEERAPVASEIRRKLRGQAVAGDDLDHRSLRAGTFRGVAELEGRGCIPSVRAIGCKRPTFAAGETPALPFKPIQETLGGDEPRCIVAAQRVAIADDEEASQGTG